MSLTFISIYTPFIEYPDKNLPHKLGKRGVQNKNQGTYQGTDPKAYTYKERWEEPPCIIAVGYHIYVLFLTMKT